MKKVRVIANKIRNKKDEEFIQNKIPPEDFLGFVYYNTEVMDADQEGISPYEFSRTTTGEIARIKEKIDRE